MPNAIAHYPSPWYINGQFDAEVTVEIMSPRPDTGEDVMVCEVGPFLEEWMPEEIGNVRLMAAAPELLAACQTVKAFLDKLEANTESCDPLSEIRRRVHAPLHEALNLALAKAEGCK